MVAFGDDNKPVKVPGLILENHKQAYRFHKGLAQETIEKQNIRVKRYPGINGYNRRI
jgi:hypothetical protein